MSGSSDLRSLFSSGGDDIAAVDVFTNRHDEWSAVAESLVTHVNDQRDGHFRVDDFACPRRNVLVFYGVGGIGKTTFSQRLETHLGVTGARGAETFWSPIPDQIGRLLPARIDLARQGGVGFEDALLAVRLALGRLGRPLRAFDIALRCYWEVNHPGEPLEGYLHRHGLLRRLSEKAAVPEDLRAVMEDLSGAVELPSAVGASALGFVTGLTKALRERHDKVRALSRCTRLPDLLDAPQDIDTLSYFPHLLAWDLAQIPAKHAATPVILLDTFEDITERGHRDVEKLYQRMVWLMPNALFVITGRNRLQWDDTRLEGQLDWTGPHRWPNLAGDAATEPRQHLVGYLSDSDRDHYLRTRLTRSGRPVIPDNVRAEIATRSYGLPLYLDLAVMRFQDVLARTGAAPGPEEFQRDFPALVARIMRDLSPDERTVLRTVSLLDAFSIDLATTASRLPRDSAALNLVERPFITYDRESPWPYRLHELLRTAVRAADAATEDRWSPADWRRAAQSTFTALRDQVPTASGYRSRRQLMACLTQGLWLACEFDLEPGWLLEAAWRYVLESIWEPLALPAPDSDGAAAAIARTLHAISLGQRAHRRDSVDELSAVLSIAGLPPSVEDLTRYYLGENQRHLGLYRESADNMRHVAAGDSPLARQALRGLSHIARHLGDFPEALSTIEALDHDTHYFRALGHLWWVHGEITLACSAYHAARQVALDQDQPGPAALAQAGLAFAAAFDDPARATSQIALANALLHGLNQTWSQAQVSTAVLLQAAGSDNGLAGHAAELEYSYTRAGLGSALAYLRFAVCYHHAIRGEQPELRAALASLEESTSDGEYQYLVDIVRHLAGIEADPDHSGPQWIGGTDSVVGRWRGMVAARRAALGLQPVDPARDSDTLEPMTGTTSSAFTSESATRALRLAALESGLPIGDARLIRIGENAIYALPTAGVIARIARSDANLSRVEKELAVARWLARNDFPAVRIAENLPQLVRVDGRVVTYWDLADTEGAATIDQLATLLREFHALPTPDFPLPTFDPFTAVPGRLADPGSADPADVEFLTDLYHDLRTRYQSLEFTDLGVIHGDAHQGNIIPTSTGPLLCDFEVVAFGPKAWDTTTIAMTVDRFDLSEADYQRFTEIYGDDVTEQPHYPLLRDIRELTMVTWLMQLVDLSDRHAAEFRHRVTSMREGDRQQKWNAF
ncbi:phosphotransferase [Nocardia tengchongensis]|uniref:phosphotransferase n=1 Tax=Nocardia tengchongensis TaxID=2055889 RepID=UPI0036C7FB07